MSVALNDNCDGKLLTVQVSGKLTGEDYRHFVPEIEQRIKQHGKIRVFFDMHDFHGWKAAALWEDVKFDIKHFSDIERLAIIGDKRWEKWMALFCRPFTTATVRFFEHSETDEARRWIENDFLVTTAEASGGSCGCSTEETTK